MGKKSIAYKRRLRQKQKQKKKERRRDKLVHVPSEGDVSMAKFQSPLNTVSPTLATTTSSTSEEAEEEKQSVHVPSEGDLVSITEFQPVHVPSEGDLISIAEFQSPLNTISPALATTTSSTSEEAEEEKQSVQKQPVNCAKLYARLEETTKRMRHYQYQLQKQKLVVETMEEECTRQIHSVRNFWKDKIYMEGSRSGIILKRAMQGFKPRL